MSVQIAEWFGFSVFDDSPIAREAAETQQCPFTLRDCTKALKGDERKSGVCSLMRADGSNVICCPNRLYGDDWKILHDISEIAFGPGLPLEFGRAAKRIAEFGQKFVVGVFGKNWGGELPIPKRGGKGAYYVDYVLALFGPAGLVRFVAAEVQTIDTTGNYQESLANLRKNRTRTPSGAGFNWENVNKRILPQLIQKGQVLEREALCKEGLFFVTPQPVFEKVLERLTGNVHDLPEYPLSPGSVTFLSYDAAGPTTSGIPAALRQISRFTTSVNQISQALATPRGLPDPGVYAKAISAAQEIVNVPRLG